ncbi:MAG: hypothetical protein AMXMBFR34_23540 [Myxococcaceae bacterium]
MDAGGAAARQDCDAGLTPGADVVSTERGPLRGEVTATGRAFRGIPYVKPPTGASRWRPPETDGTCWSGVRDATASLPLVPATGAAAGPALRRRRAGHLHAGGNAGLRGPLPPRAGAEQLVRAYPVASCLGDIANKTG